MLVNNLLDSWKLMLTVTFYAFIVHLNSERFAKIEKFN